MINKNLHIYSLLTWLSSIYGFWLPLWYLQTLLMHNVQDYDSMLSTITLLTMLNVWVGILLTCGQHLSSSPVFNGVRSLVVYECFVDRCLSFCLFSFGHCVVCSSSSICGLWLSLWYLQTLLKCLYRFTKRDDVGP
jgi:hypothetical protein